MRLIDADELKEHIIVIYVHGRPVNVVSIASIDSAPTVKTYCYYCGALMEVNNND